MLLHDRIVILLMHKSTTTNGLKLKEEMDDDGPVHLHIQQLASVVQHEGYENEAA